MQQPRRRRRHDLILDHPIALTNAEIQRFLKRHKIASASARAKDELRIALRQALKASDITTEAVVAFLDEVTPWGKQHIHLYKGPLSKDWRNQAWVAAHLKAHKPDHLVDARTDVIVLPEDLELACINWSARHLRITAIRRREGWVRNEECDKTKKKAPDGRPLWFRGRNRDAGRNRDGGGTGTRLVCQGAWAANCRQYWATKGGAPGDIPIRGPKGE